MLERSTGRGSSRLTVTRTDGGWRWTKAFRPVGGSGWTPVQDADFHPVTSGR